MLIYKSIEEVPRTLGSVTDWRTQGRIVLPGAVPDARVTIPGRNTPGGGSQKALLYEVRKTRPIPGLSDADRAALRAAQACSLCGQVRTNPLGKVVLPGRSKKCRLCETPPKQ